jgi:hypothetical protein
MVQNRSGCFRSATSRAAVSARNTRATSRAPTCQLPPSPHHPNSTDSPYSPVLTLFVHVYPLTRQSHGAWWGTS